MKKFIGSKEFYIATIMIALPIMAQQFVTSFVNLIDNLMIGNVGTVALSSVTVANKLYSIFNSSLFGFCGAAGIFIAQYFGAKEYDKCQKVLNINLMVNLFIACLFTLFLTLKPEFFIRFFSSDTIVINESLKYLKYAIISYIPFSISIAIMMGLRAVGVNKIQLAVGIITVCINTGLNYVLIFGHFGAPQLGVVGAAIATSIARIVEMCIYLSLLIKNRYLFHISVFELLHLDKKLIQTMLSKAFPLTLNEIFYALGLTMVFIAYVRCDEALTASVSVVDTVMQIAYIIFSGLASAVSILIGKRLGANEIDKAKENSRYLITFGMFVGGCIGIIFFCICPFIANLYNVEPVIKEAIVGLVRIRACMLPIYVFNVTIFFILRAGGDTLSTLIMDSGLLWGMNVTIATLLSMFVPIPLVMLSLVVECTDFIKMIISFYFYRKGKWARNLTV